VGRVLAPSGESGSFQAQRILWVEVIVANDIKKTLGAAFSVVACVALSGGAAVAGNDPDLISVGVGFYDQATIDPNLAFLDVSEVDNREQAVDFRVEYRFGTSLLSFIEPYAKLKPWLGGEVTSDGAIYGVGGILIDVPLGPIVFTPSFGAGLYASGGGKDLGSALEFRSQLEVGYQFDNQSRFSAGYSHISNAGITETNPGTNILSIYYHVPTSWLIGGK